MQSSGWSRRQLTELSEKLRLRYAEQWRKVLAQAESMEPAGTVAVHDAQDESYAEEREEEWLAGMHHERLELADIEQALARLHGETYGVCIDCGTPIGYARLEAYPTAKRCLSCQGKHEQRQSRAGH